MNKFKFEPPQEHRRSLQQPKNQHLNLVTILDKCTQILRQDRLFLRNQIKNCNPDILDIFKQFPRSSQLQNLQIKLRKYVQNVKNRIKTEQLNKFKETLSMNSIIPQPKRQNNQLKPSQSTLKQPFKPNCSVQLNKTTNNRNTKSQEHGNGTISNHLNMNSSLRHFQELLKHKFNQEVIQQRESQNVTSARQNRQQHQHNKAKPPLQEQLFDSLQNKMAGKSASFNHFKPNNTLDSNLSFLNDFNREKLKLTIQEPAAKSTPWQFQKKAKKALYQFQNNTQKQSDQIGKSRQKQSTNEQRQDSIFDKHFYGSSKQSKLETNQYFSQNSNTYEIKNPISFSIKDTPSNNLAHSKLQQAQTINAKAEPSFPLKESQFTRQVILPVKTSVSRIEDSRKSQENLFTPLDLLNQCRNFLKHRETSNQKSNVELNLGDTNLTQTEIAFHPNPYPQSFEQKQRQQPSLPQQKFEPIKKQEDSVYVFPQIRESDKKSQEQNSDSKKIGDYHFTHFQTFANSLEHKPFIYPSKLPSVPAKHVFKGLNEQKIPMDFSIEDLLESMMEITDMNPFITVKSLTILVNNHPNGQVLKSIFKNFLQMSKNDEICLPSLSSAINQKYNQQHHTLYPHNDKTINSVYDLLDIDQKGYINKEDVMTFLTQIEEAEVENYEEVSQELWRLFEGADFNNQHKLTYWHFYLVKNSQEFERVSQLLGEFQFQIQRNQ